MQIDGRLRAADIAALRGACEAVPGTLVLKLDQLWSADSHGLEAIHELVLRGAQLQGVSPYLELLLSTKRATTYD